MCKSISTLGMEREEWLRLRKGGIGGSDAGAVCGLNPYSSPMSVYWDKTTDELDLRDNEAMRQGRDLEEYVARRFTEETGLKVRRSNKMYSGKRTWYIAAVILGQGFVYSKIHWDLEFAERLIALEEDFWNHHVQARKIPNPNGSEFCNAVLEKYFHRSKKEGAVPLPEDIEEKLDRRQDISEEMKRLEKEKTQIKQEVKIFMDGHGEANSERYRVTWQEIDSERLDTRMLKQEQPEVYRKYAKCSRSSRFTIKAA